MGKSGILSVLALLILVGQAMANDGIGGLDVYITQSDKIINSEKTGKGYRQLSLGKASFSLHYKAQQIGVCASSDINVFKKAKLGSDTMSDYSSCLFTFKAYGMSKDGGMLILGEDGANWLNKAHGARDINAAYHYYQVDYLAQAGGADIPLDRNQKPLYLVIWDDINLNRVTDPGELAYLQILFQ